MVGLSAPGRLTPTPSLIWSSAGMVPDCFRPAVTRSSRFGIRPRRHRSPCWKVIPLKCWPRLSTPTPPRWSAVGPTGSSRFGISPPARRLSRWAILWLRSRSWLGRATVPRFGPPPIAGRLTDILSSSRTRANKVRPPRSIDGWRNCCRWCSAWRSRQMVRGSLPVTWTGWSGFGMRKARSWES